MSPNEERRMKRKRDEVTAEIEKAEARVAEIDLEFCRPGFFDRTEAHAVASLEAERADLQTEVDRLVEEWERLEKLLSERSPGVGR